VDKTERKLLIDSALAAENRHELLTLIELLWSRQNQGRFKALRQQFPRQCIDLGWYWNDSAQATL
jgi:hypothetical protein